jgi:(p)ppGpp synthase/HD superfamily hydrolase
MTTEQSRHMSGMHLVPYIQVATLLIGKSRQAGGNMFRHQIDTMGILIDYDYIDAVLLKASIVHDILEDIPYFDHNILLSVDSDSPAVYELVKEVSRRSGETKPEFLLRIRESGSHNAKILKVADRISNMISLGFVNDLDFVERYINETEQHVLPIAEQVSRYMVIELGDLIKSRRNYLKGYSMYLTSSQETSFMGFI